MKQDENKPDAVKLMGMLNSLLQGVNTNKIVICADDDECHDLIKMLARKSNVSQKIIEVDFSSKRRI